MTALLLAGQPGGLEAKSYSSGGGHTYSSSSSHSSGGSHSFSGSSRSSSGASHSSSSGSSKSSASSSSRSSGSPKSNKSFTSSSGKSYGSGSSWSDENRRGYNSSKSYTAPNGASASPRSSKEAAPSSAFTFDTAAARARKEEGSRQEFSRFKEANAPANNSTAPNQPAPSYRVTPPPLTPSASGQYRRPDYIPDAPTIWSRPARSYTIFAPYVSRPVVVYRDPYNSFFWWWLLDRSLDDRAYWAYHHRYDMDPARYQALVADNRQLEQRVAELEAQQVPRDPSYTPPGVDRDLMYSDQHVKRVYSNRPTASGRVVFWLFGVPVAIGASWFLIWFIFYKRWQPATA